MINIIMADDHCLIREGFVRLIEKQEDMKIIAAVDTAERLFKELRNAEANIVVLDISLPDKNGIDALKDLKQQRPKIAVLILSMHPEEHFALRALQNGASGYLRKGTNASELMKAIRKVCSGGRYVSETMAERLAEVFSTHDNRPALEKLSDREFQVLLMIGDGQSSKRIASTLSISDNTVRTYRTRIMDKLQLKTTAEIIQYAIQQDLLE